MTIYTKTGDKGETGLLGGRRVSKDAPVISILGDIDEINSYLGFAASLIDPKLSHAKILRNKIKQVQRTLLRLGSIMAGAKLTIPKSVVQKYEKEIDTWAKLMPSLTKFVLPGGNKSAAALFTARAVVRRLERETVALSKSEKTVTPLVLVYVNRLSDYLFTLARYLNFREQSKEVM